MTVAELRQALESLPEDYIVLCQPNPGTFPPMPAVVKTAQIWTVNRTSYVIILPDMG